MELFIFIEFYMIVLIFLNLMRLAKILSKNIHLKVSFIGAILLLLFYLAVELMDLDLGVITSTNEYRNYYLLFVTTIGLLGITSGIKIFRDRNQW